ncbi:MAG: rhomboid family intramembrane serine protease [Eubacterium sp.]|nr:rhomboid family intramembrane serine protease [Eubacterium sp.]
MLSKWERKYGKYAIPNLTLYLVIGYVIGYVIDLVNSDMYSLLLFDPYKILHGQVWRIFTWLFTAPESLGIFTIVMLFLYYSLGTSLEHTWGVFRYNMFLLSGFLFTILGAIIVYIIMVVYYSNSTAGVMYSDGIAALFGNCVSIMVSTFYINMSIFLAFAVTYPNVQLLLYFVIPVKIKWFGYLYGAFIAYDIFSTFRTYSDAVYLAIIHGVIVITSLLNFLIYWMMDWKRGASHAKRSYEYKKSIKTGNKQRVYEDGTKHKCYICGRTDADYPDLTFRYCSKCSGNKEYCQDHLFTHEHK